MKKINEIFYSLQGEGYHTGIPAIFVRFSGCNMKCSFCDTVISTVATAVICPKCEKVPFGEYSLI